MIRSLRDWLFPHLAEQQGRLDHAQLEYARTLRQRHASREPTAVTDSDVRRLNADLKDRLAEFERIAATMSLMPPANEDDS